MTKSVRTRRLAIVAAQFTKRKLDEPDGLYDRFFKTRAGQSLQNLSELKKDLVELGLYGTNVFLDEKLQDTTALKKYLLEIASSAPANIAKRIRARVQR